VRESDQSPKARILADPAGLLGNWKLKLCFVETFLSAKANLLFEPVQV